jgi:hypothetical protein
VQRGGGPAYQPDGGRAEPAGERPAPAGHLYVITFEMSLGSDATGEGCVERARGLPGDFDGEKRAFRQAHSSSERSVGYFLLMHRSVQDRPNPLPYQTRSNSTLTDAAERDHAKCHL